MAITQKDRQRKNMNEQGSRNDRAQGGYLPVHHIGIVYCTSNQFAQGREMEKVADCEVIDVACAVKDALGRNGYQAELVDLNPEEISRLRRFDLVFNLAETIYGFPLADYEVAARMEGYHIPFTGSGARTLNICLDKVTAKCELLRNGIGTPAFEVFKPGSPILNLLRYPLFVKPVREDGSIGISSESVVHNDSELRRQVNKIHHRYNQAALVEQYIDGRDITAAVVGNGDQAVVLPLSEITYPDQSNIRFLTFEGKWLSDSQDFQVSQAQCPCVLPAPVERTIKEIALCAYHALGCRDYARIDFRLRGKNPFVLEVNPNPCINPDDSGFVRAGCAAGYSYADLVLKIVADAVEDRLRRVEPGYVEVSQYQAVRES
jgi:D-alanine-D-alanine ligase